MQCTQHYKNTGNDVQPVFHTIHTLHFCFYLYIFFSLMNNIKTLRYVHIKTVQIKTSCPKFFFNNIFIIYVYIYKFTR